MRNDAPRLWNLALRTLTLMCGLSLVLATPALAVPFTYKHDQFNESLQAAANEVNGQSLATQPGFAATEAFGVLFRPDPAHYPITIQGIDMILAAPPNAPDLTTHAQIEVWNSTADGPDPGTGSPMFQISTTEIFNPDSGADGVPLQGNVGLQINFDYSDPDGHPDPIAEGNIWVMVRFTSTAQSMEAQWGTAQCIKLEPLTCGCQNVGTINDFATTPQANVMQIIQPAGACSGGLGWTYAETTGVTGDFLIRARAEVAAEACNADCTGKVCGNDGCGGSCGSCPANEVCNTSGQCEPFCLPDCANKNCGDDGCGGTCGSCAGGETCVNGVCDGGGTTCDPPCEGGQVCDNGTCVPSCIADCNGKNCGTDGCGGSCGTCTGGQTCTSGVCAGGTPGDLAITEISPTSGTNDDYVNVTVLGTGFQQGLDVLIAGQSLAGIKVTGNTLIEAQVPPGLAEGVHTVIVKNPDGATATLTEAYTVTAGAAGPVCGDGLCALNDGENTATCPADCGAPPGDSGGCSCESGSPVGPAAPLAALAALLVLVALRRRGHRQPKAR